MDITADGAVWAFADKEAGSVFADDDSHWFLADGQAWGLYVISPEAVAAVE
jgi:hypothetical protein